jgi:zinc finger SWIM domain-containing protein 3
LLLLIKWSSTFCRKVLLGYSPPLAIKTFHDPLEQKASCNCGEFARTGVLCSHVLKVLDLMNIKLLPNHYVLKRWTREAKYGTIQDNKGKSIIEDPKLDAMLRYKCLSKKFLNLAYLAASDLECCILVDNALDCLAKQL